MQIRTKWQTDFVVTYFILLIIPSFPWEECEYSGEWTW
jgi:hypothetical protein